MHSNITVRGEWIFCSQGLRLIGSLWVSMFANQIKCIDNSSLSLLNSFVFLHCFFFLVTHGVTFYRADTQTNKMKLALTNSSHLFVFCHKNKIFFWLIKIRKVTKVKQTLQISHSEVIFAMCLSLMTVVNRAHDYRIKIPKNTVDYEMTLQVIISRCNSEQKSILFWCYGTEEKFHL